MQLRRSKSPKEIDRIGLKSLENNKNIQLIISVNTNILLNVLQATPQLRKHPVLFLASKVPRFKPHRNMWKNTNRQNHRNVLEKYLC
jgi:hypothetical protein